MPKEKDRYFSGFLWAPSEEYWHYIIRRISKQYQVTHVRQYKFHTHDDLRNMIVRLYKYDDVNIKKIKKHKIAALEKYQPKCLHFQIYVPNPEFTHSKHGIIEPNVIDMKRSIRRKYKKKIDNYITDIIIHISDNQKQTKFIDDIVNNSITY